MQRPLSLLLLLPALLVAGCYNPITPSGLRCTTTSKCPDGQYCAIDGICYGALCSPACAGNEICDIDTLTCVPGKQDDPEDQMDTPDNRAHVGYVVGAPARVLGTVVSPHVVLTCSNCLGTATAGNLVFESGGSTVGVREMVKHPTADVAALYLSTVLSAPSITLASTGPTSGVSYACIAPSMTGAARYQYIVTMSAMASETFDWTGKSFASDVACAMVGGPTFASAGTGDVLVGMHTRSSCEGGSNQDLRIDLLASWIQERMEDAAPETCPATGTCSGTCGAWSCSDTGGTVQETCTPDTSKCGANQTCNSSLVCENNAVCNNGDVRLVQGACGIQVCSGGQWGSTQASNSRCTNSAFPTCSASNGYSCVCNSGQATIQGDCGVRTCSNGSYGSPTASNSRCTDPQFPSCDTTSFECECNAGQYLTCPGDGCGRRYCVISSGTYNPCTATDWACDGDDVCVQSGSTFNCQASSCSTAGYADCSLAPGTHPAEIGIGASFETATGCSSGWCKQCTCNASGTFTCGTCYNE